MSSADRLMFLPAARLLVFTWLTFAGVFPASAGGTCSRLEASFNIPGLVTDPFDYVATDVKVTILQPDASAKVLPAFFDGGTTWRVRHTPALPGNYSFTAITLNGSPAPYSNLSHTNWSVTGPPTGPGFVRRDPSNPNRFITDNGRRHYPFGHNVAWSSSAANALNILPKMGPAHENWSRIWMTHFYEWQGLGLNLDWPKVGGTFGQLSLTNARNWDAIVTAAEQNGVAFQMVLQHHGQYSASTDANWQENPYNTANGGFLSNAAQFFTNSTAKTLTKRKYRYILARWGYSPAIMAWELFNEVQFTDAAQAGQWNVVGAWHDEMAQFLRTNDVYQHLITTSSEMNRPIWNQTDYYQHHDYVSDYITALADPAGVPSGQPVRPVFGGESGRDNTVYYGQHAPVWAGIMGAQSGAAQPWYWDTMDSQRCYELMRAARDFVLNAGVAEQNALVRSAPLVAAGGGLYPLVFGLGGGFNPATQDTFDVGGAAPFGAGTAPPYLQSQNGHPGWTPNGYRFNVNYQVAGTFAVQVNSISACGATLQILLDNVLQTNVTFAGNATCGTTYNPTSTNAAFTINVPSGAHSVKLYNPGADWVLLGNLTLDPYASLMGAYQIGQSNFAALWLWHRTNIYRATATTTVSGTVPLNGLQPGNYAATWWDTFAGRPLSNFNFTVANTDPVSIPTPPVLRSAAFFAGKPPQAALTAPLLTHTLGTNSPPLSLPLTITNGGGLPLSYSLSVTGASPVAYAATTSAQAGGPAYVWRDISGAGRDITTNFIALAAPKNSRDEGIAGPFELGFNFPFFSGAQAPGTFTQLYVSPNGFVTFSPFTADRSTNTVLPSAAAPANSIALFWDDLILTNANSRVYTLADPISGTFTVQFQSAQFRGSPASVNVTCQLVLKTTGEILMQYKAMSFSNACTVGLQNAATDAGLQLAFNQNFLQTNFAIRLTPTRWFDVNANAGLMPGAAADTLQISLSPAGLDYGTYAAMLVVTTGDAAQPLFTLPIELDVSPIGTWRQTHFGSAANSGDGADAVDPDGEGLINVLEYAFNQDPNMPGSSPISWALAGDFLTLSFERTRPAPPDLEYLAEVTDDLLSGVWNSGPTYTSQFVSDNGDGTETVTITDLLAVGSAPQHFLRIRIVRH